MATAIVAVIGETELFSQKVWVSSLAAASVAVQTTGTKFFFGEKAKKYLALRNSIRGLRLDLSLAETTDDLKILKGKYVEILKQESEMP